MQRMNIRFRTCTLKTCAYCIAVVLLLIVGLFLFRMPIEYALVAEVQCARIDYDRPVHCMICSEQDLRMYIDDFKNFYKTVKLMDTVDVRTFDFEHYDYILNIGAPIDALYWILWDECSLYHYEFRPWPCYIESGNEVRNSIFVYHIPKGKYRLVCG